MYFSTFQILCLLVLPNYKTQCPPGAEQSSEIFYHRHHIWSLWPFICCMCVCVCLFLYLCFTFYFSLLSMTTMLFDLTAALNKPLLKQNNVPISILMTIAFSLVQRSGIGFHHNYCDKISCFQLISRVRFDWAHNVGHLKWSHHGIFHEINVRNRNRRYSMRPSRT